MRKFFAVLALSTLTLSGAMVATAKEKLTGEEQLNKLIDGRVAGQPQSCISNYRGGEMKVIDKTALVYVDGDTLWVNRTQYPDTLDSDDVLVIKLSSTMQLCKVDIVTTVDQFNGFFKGTVFLKDFVPYKKSAS